MKGRRFVALVLAAALVASMSGCRRDNKNFQTGNVSSDAQNGWNIFNHPVTRGEGGYYFLISHSSQIVEDKVEKTRSSYMLIMFMQDDGNSVVVCSKPECKHNSEECPACLSLESNNPRYDENGNVIPSITGYDRDKIYYHNGKIYVIYNDDVAGYAYLEEVAPNGAYRTRLFEIGNSAKGYCLTFNDQDVFIYKREGSTSGYEEVEATIRRRSLDGKEDEVIYSYKGMGAMLFAVKNYGDKLYFLEELYAREKDENGRQKSISFQRKGLFAYDYQSKTVENVIDAAITDYTFDTDNNTLYYYVNNDGMYKKTFNDGKTQKIYNMEKDINSVAQISFLSGNIYMSNCFMGGYTGIPQKLVLIVFDKDGKEQNRITISQMNSEIFWGDNDKIFLQQTDMREGGYSLYYIDIKDGKTDLSMVKIK